MVLARNTLLLATLDLAELLGVSRRRIYQEVQLNEQDAEPNALVPAEKIVDAMEAAALATQCRDFGLLIADRRDHLNLGLLGLMLEQCSTIAEMHQLGERYLHLQNAALEFKLVRERTPAVAQLRVHVEENSKPRHYVEALFAMYVHLIALFLGPKWRPEAVCFVHERLGRRADYERRFGKDVRFEQNSNCIVFRPGELDREVAARDAQAKLRYEGLLRELSAAGASRDFVAEVSRLARMLLPSGSANVARVAELMETSTRSLQRRLTEQQTSFGKVLIHTRSAMAREYLGQAGMTVNKLAPLLGFSDPSTASRFLTKQVHASARELKSESQTKRGPTSTR